MNIGIWDLDYIVTYKPNIKCMKISSYYKQNGANVTLIKNEIMARLKYDVLIIARENEDISLPKGLFIDENKTKLLGNFGFRKTIRITREIMRCRPDYLLYDVPKNRDSYLNANIVTFFHEGVLMKDLQDFRNSFSYKKRTIVYDRDFWSADKKDIIWCLERLKDEKNIVFEGLISLKKIIYDELIREKFLELNFTSGTIFRYFNDTENDLKSSIDIINFLNILKKHSNSNVGIIPINSKIEEINNIDDLMINIERCLSIIKIFKINNRECEIYTKDKSSNKYNWIFKEMEKWTKFCWELSYVEYLTNNICLVDGVVWHEVINNKIKWKNNNIKFLLYLLNFHYPLIETYGAIKNKDESIRLQNIDLTKIKNITYQFEDKGEQYKWDNYL